MKQFWTIFRFEFKNYAKSKAFLILTLLLAVGAGVALSFPRIQAALHTGKESAPQEVIRSRWRTGPAGTRTLPPHSSRPR